MLHTKIKELRKEKGFTQEDMAALLHVTQHAYSQIETGKTKLDTERLITICEKLEVSPEQLLHTQPQFTFNDKVENSQVAYIQNLYSEQKETIQLLKAQATEKDTQIKSLLQQNAALISLLKK